MYQGSPPSDRMPNGLKWSRCNYRNKVHSERNALESSQNHFPQLLVQSDLVAQNWSISLFYSLEQSATGLEMGLRPN